MEIYQTLLGLSLAMAVGLLFTRIVKPFNLPNVTGYLIGGMLVGPSVLNFINSETTESFNIIVTLALGFIAFSIGCEFKLKHLKEIGGKVTVITIFQALTAVVFVFVSLLLFGYDLPIVFVLSAIATATAPAATLMVVRQYKANGPVTQTLLPVVAMDDAVGLVIFSVFFSIAKTLASGDELHVGQMLLAPLKEIGLSLLFGAAIGAVLALCVKFFRSRANRLSLMILSVILGVALSEWLNLSSLLVCMMIGAIFANLRSDSDAILDGCDRWTPPLFMLFFVISGAELDLSMLRTVGIIGIVYIIARALGKYSGAYLGATLTHSDKQVRRHLGITLLPQAGVAVGMAQMAVSAFPGSDYGAQIRAVVLCATLVYEIVGPLLTKISLTAAGEIPKTEKKVKKKDAA